MADYPRGLDYHNTQLEILKLATSHYIFILQLKLYIKRQNLIRSLLIGGLFGGLSEIPRVAFFSPFNFQTAQEESIIKTHPQL